VLLEDLLIVLMVVVVVVAVVVVVVVSSYVISDMAHKRTALFWLQVEEDSYWPLPHK